ncbi:undecaprenyl-diphosphatase [Parazoarcus communis]|uniref:Undecaprenyl-diphosphatase n=1 Tax=Parazoarcus communis TaxID=41977 RepID=A0A2U8GQW4_9RHOO|nr:undecaprenyl-diphosphate phosphatase [Parazoarcus communis]AWI76057.1 undecaprenyl-diphosphatase [Parazoarcus communis]TVT52564.1 MAG: undecaprenyl-diphosphate phosphatase [Azoarcus sp. PHD]|tara:strand:- start:19145 stop:19969 length:825 start_codon:yes stop_codon:yes gene_type:complete
MDIQLLFTAAILGIIEGLTEFLPVSSTGHLIIVGDLLGYTDDTSKVFKIVIQFAAILAVCWDYRERLIKVASGLTTEPASQRFVGMLFVAFLPAAVLGLMFHSTIKSLLFNPLTVATALVVGGFIILYVEKRAYHPRVETVDAMSWGDALKVGFAQALAMIPGTSRSGSTIMGGLIFGLSRKAAAEFSFFLAIPTMFAATVYDLYKNWSLLRLEDVPVFAVGSIASFVAAMWAVKSFIRFISNHTFIVFAWYRIVFGLIVLATWQLDLVSWSEP